jgi:oligoendopeptidase F
MRSQFQYTPQDMAALTWEQIEPFGRELIDRPLHAAKMEAWLADWSDFSRLVSEISQRRYVAFTVNTEDSEAERQYNAYLEEIFPASQQVEQQLKQKLLQSGFEPAGWEVPLRNIRAEVALYRPENLPLLSEELKLSNAYDQIISAQTVQWEGEERTIAQLTPLYQEPARSLREHAWRLGIERQLADRKRLDDLWQQMLDLRLRIARNAGLSDYRAYCWQHLLRFDYTPQDCKKFHLAIEQVAVPAASRVYAKRRQLLGLDTLRPWDLDVDLYGESPLRPHQKMAELVSKTGAIFHRIDHRLGEYFDLMCDEGLLDLENRKGKAPGGYCTNFDLARRPFIFMNGVGTHEDVQTLLHEGGHAFHVFEIASLPYFSQLQVGLEFAEVASTSIELLGAPHLTADQGGFYTAREAARARTEHLGSLIRFWPYMAVVDAFQHWVYENPAEAMQPRFCDRAWQDLWLRFMPDVDWSGFEEALITGWQRKLHIFQAPFYYVEYGLSQMGALQVWKNSLSDKASAVAAYRRALALGGTATLPDLYRAAGASLAFDVGTLADAVQLAETTIFDLEAELTGGATSSTT